MKNTILILISLLFVTGVSEGKEVSSLKDSDIPTPVTPKPTTMAETVVAPTPEVAPPVVPITGDADSGYIPGAMLRAPTAQWHDTARNAWISRQNVGYLESELTILHSLGQEWVRPDLYTPTQADPNWELSQEDWKDGQWKNLEPLSRGLADGSINSRASYRQALARAQHYQRMMDTTDTHSFGLIASALFILSLLCVYLLRKKETEYVEEPGPQEKAHREKERQEQERQEQSRKKNEEKELDDCRVKAEQGDSKSQYKLAWMYSTGQGVPQDHNEVVKWLRKSAEQGDANAQDNLGLMYYDGQGVPQDDKEATKWLRKSAEQGYAKAHYNLGVMHVKGRGVLQDYVMAHMYWNIAAVGGDKEAIKGRSAIEKQMTPSQIEKAQDLAREWMGTHQ
jgi:TPR repeat protein